MKNFLLTIFILIININAMSQIKSNYARGFEIGFKEGYCYNNETIDCFYPMTPLAPLPRINENKDNYTQGYNRGFQFGLDLRRSNDALNESNNSLNRQITKFNEYVPQNPTQAMAEVGMIKQKIYDARYNWIQQRIDNLAQLSDVLFNKETIPSDYDWRNIKKNYWNRVVNYTNSIRTVDFADNFQFSLIQSNYNEIERYFYDSYNELIIQKQKPVTKDNSKTNARIYVYRPCGMVGMLTKVKLYANGNLICKIPICSGYNFTVTEPGQLSLVFAGGGCFTRQEVSLNIFPGQKEYYIRYDVGSDNCTYTIVSSSTGRREYSGLKRKNTLSK